MRAIAYVRELEEDEWVEYGLQRNIIEQYANMVGMQAIIIDKTQTMRRTNGEVMYSWDELIEKYKDHRIIFIDINAKKDLKNMNHKKDENVIFCIGSDETGFEGFDLTDRETYRINTYPVEKEHHAILVTGFIIADKHMRDK